jgi:hypothetical protein
MSAPTEQFGCKDRLLLIVRFGDRIEQAAFRVHEAERVEEMAHELDGRLGVLDVRTDLVRNYRGRPRTTVWL